MNSFKSFNTYNLYRACRLALCSAFVCSALLISSFAHAAKPLEGVSLEVAYSVSPPFVIVDNSFDSPTGIDVDLTLELQRRTGFTLKGGGLHIMNFSDLMTLAERGEVQIAGGAVTLSESRSKIFDFSGATVDSRVVIVARRNSAIDGFKSLNGLRVAAEAGTVAGDLIPEDANISVKIDECPTTFMAIYRVSRGRSDALIIDEPLIQFYLDNWKNSGLEKKYIVPDSASKLGLLFTKGTKESKILQETFHEMEKDGTVARIIKKYLPSYEYRQPTNDQLTFNN